MPNDKDEFFHSCIFNGFILDANLFLLLAFGTSHKRTEGLDEEMEITKTIVSFCSERKGKLVLTPHIIAEISNMLINRTKRSNYAKDDRFIKMTEFIRMAKEYQVPKDMILDNIHLSYIGFTDLSILEAAKKERYGVLTGDQELFCRLSNESCQVVNPKIIAEIKSMNKLFIQ